MPNTDPDDNPMQSTLIVAPKNGAHWTLDGSTVEGSRYVRGTVELDANHALSPAIGTIEQCEFAQIGDDSELDDGAMGTEVMFFDNLGYKVSLTARFRRADQLPTKGSFFSIMGPEGAAMAIYRFVVVGEPKVTWEAKGLRKVQFEGQMRNSMAREILVSAGFGKMPNLMVSEAESNPIPTAEGGAGDPIPD